MLQSGPLVLKVHCSAELISGFEIEIHLITWNLRQQSLKHIQPLISISVLYHNETNHESQSVSASTGREVMDFV